MRLKRFNVTPELTLSKGSLSWLIAALLLTALWYAPHTPVWALLAALIVAGWRYRILIQGKPLPSKTLKVILTLAAFAAIMLNFKSILGRDPGITFLILLATLKLLELKSQRDFMFVVFLCYFLVLGIFLFNQSIPSLIFMIAAFVIITAAVLRLNRQDEERVKPASLVKSASGLMLLSLPFAVVLFLFFPRTSGPLWNLPQDPYGQHRSGFNDTVYPGQIAKLAASANPAFRVHFPDNNMPAYKDLYFRGVVLWFTNGRGWFQGILSSHSYYRSDFVEDTSGGIRQEIVLEPHFRRWLFGLDTPVDIPNWSRVLPGRVFRTRRLVERYLRYEVVSRVNFTTTESLDSVRKRWALQLPRRLNPRITALARSWRKNSGSTEEIVRAGLEYFRDGGFVYSMSPGVMDRQDPLGDFLFDKKKGFCEHYAASFTLLMRAAGVYSRMVTGYQGGTFNPVGNFLLVRQSDAHAWVEVWFEGKGWKRVDPTAMVSPERLEYGIDMSRSLESLGDGSGESRSDAINRALRRGFFKRLFQTLEYYWDTVNNKWNLWIMSYDLYRQRDFMDVLGIHDFSWLTLFTLIMGLGFAVYLLITFFSRRKKALDEPLLELYRQFCLRVARYGLVRNPWEGPLDFEARMVKTFPQNVGSIRPITDLFVALRYGHLTVTPERLKTLKRMMRKLALTSRPPGVE